MLGREGEGDSWLTFFIFRCGWFAHLCLWWREGRGGEGGPVAALYDIPPGRLMSCTAVRDCARDLVGEGKKGGKWSIECDRISAIGDL